MRTLRRALRTALATSAAAVASATVVAALATPAARAETLTPTARFDSPQHVAPTCCDPYRSIDPTLFADGGAALAWGYVGGWLSLRPPGGPFAPAPVRADVRTRRFAAAAAAEGGGVVAWDERGRTRAAPIAAGRLGDPVDVGAGWPREMLLDSRGDTLVSLSTRQWQRLVLAVRPPGGRFHAPQAFGDGMRAERLVPLRSGFAIAWVDHPCVRAPAPRHWDCETFVRAAVSRDGRRFGPVQTVARLRAAEQRPERVELRLLPRGGDGALLVWADGGRRSRVRLALLGAGATRFSPARTISRPGRRSRAIEAAANGRGDALVAWVEVDRSRAKRVRAATVDRRGRAARSRQLSGARLEAKAPRVRLGARGDALVSWADGPRWWLRTRAAGDRFGAAVELPPTQRPWLNQLAIDRDGQVLALFSGAASDANEGGGVWGAVWPAGRIPSQPRRLANGWQRGLQLAVNAPGEALAVWTGPDGGDATALRASVRLPGGDFPPATAVATERIGDPVARINERGDLLISAYDFPDGGDSYDIGAVTGATLRAGG